MQHYPNSRYIIYVDMIYCFKSIMVIQAGIAISNAVHEISFIYLCCFMFYCEGRDLALGLSSINVALPYFKNRASELILMLYSHGFLSRENRRNTLYCQKYASSIMNNSCTGVYPKVSGLSR